MSFEQEAISGTEGSTEEKPDFWSSYIKWDAIVTIIRIGAWMLVVLWVFIVMIWGTDWSLKLRMIPMLLIPAFGIALYGLSAMKLQCHLAFRLLIALPLAAPLVISIYLISQWPQGL